MSKNKITDLHSLDREIADLENKQSQVKGQLINNWKYLRSDYFSIIKNSILHKSQEEGRTSFVYWLFKIPEFKSRLGKAAERLTVKVENILVKWIDKLTE